MPAEIENEFETDTGDPVYPADLFSAVIVIGRDPTLNVNEFVVALAPLPSVTLIATSESPTTVGEPEITPVDAFRDNPACKVPVAIAYVFEPPPPVDDVDSE